ncbi:MAG: hypothetical protein KF851_12125 [Pirellulaceae bacterium]|nr:hypothetical protein [Pirellulaceae bacterium]
MSNPSSLPGEVSVPRLTCVFFLAILSYVISPLVGQTNRDLTDWSVSLDGGKSFQPIIVPGTIEDQIDVNFDGVSLYKTKLPAEFLEAEGRKLVRFAAVATHAKVFANDILVAEHLGGWTPFTVDLTVPINERDLDQPFVLAVEVDERVGHNTQGFLPIVTNHFGGIWQPVALQLAPPAVLVKDAIGVFPKLAEQSLSFVAPLSLESDRVVSIEVALTELDRNGEPAAWEVLNGEWVNFTGSPRILGSSGFFRDEIWGGTIKLPQPWKPWSPADPQRYALRIRVHAEEGDLLDEHVVPFGVREFVTRGDAFVLNGEPISIRGVLNWGYAPPSVAPSLDEAWMRDEIRFAQERGFNMMKFCLWVPPKRYLELCDELGMLAWMEYPTWHPKLDQQHLADLEREYAEFFEFDRNHPSIVLRSLTCETGPSADINVIRSLYNKCKTMIPGAIVEDDSSWISWNRVHDFYDDHPYGNNHNWVATLARLKRYIAARPVMPLALGEAIAADTWTVPTEEAIRFAAENPAHGAWAVADQLRWQTELAELAAKRGRKFDPQALLPHSRHYGQLMRKFQIEVFHREVPHGAYVVSVIRDFPKAAMGLIDYAGEPKHTPEEWSFQGDRMILLRTENDRRSFWGGEVARVELFPKDLAGVAAGSWLEVSLRNAAGISLWSGSQHVTSASGTDPLVMTIPIPTEARPQRLTLHATWRTNTKTLATNAWPVWAFPQAQKNPAAVKAVVHPSAQSLIADLPIEVVESADVNSAIIVTRKLDRELLEALRQGARVLLLPDGGPGSFAVQDHWFLRGSLVAMPHDGETWHQPFSLNGQKGLTPFLNENVAQNMLVELQHFDLAGPVVPQLDHYLSSIDPLVLLWDNHDMREVRTHGLAFRMHVGERGELLVSSLNHRGATNAAGRWLLERWLEQLVQRFPDNRQPTEALENLATLERELNRQIRSLAQERWQFRPDGDQVGVTEGWFASEFDDSEWSTIGIDRHWESQGYPALDHWAWYRKRVAIPADYHSPTTYLNFTGVDDYADVYVNGVKVASLGDRETKQTAFELRVSLDISEHIRPGEDLQIAIAVYDWYGSGGIFRPVSLSTEPLSTSPPILK